MGLNFKYLQDEVVFPAPATTGAFNLINYPQATRNAPNTWHHLATSTVETENLYLQISLKYSVYSKARRLTSPTLLIHLSPLRNYQILRSLCHHGYHWFA